MQMPTLDDDDHRRINEMYEKFEKRAFAGSVTPRLKSRKAAPSPDGQTPVRRILKIEKYRETTPTPANNRESLSPTGGGFQESMKATLDVKRNSVKTTLPAAARKDMMTGSEIKEYIARVKSEITDKLITLDDFRARSTTPSGKAEDKRALTPLSVPPINKQRQLEIKQKE